MAVSTWEEISPFLHLSVHGLTNCFDIIQVVLFKFIFIFIHSYIVVTFITFFYIICTNNNITLLSIFRKYSATCK